MSTSPQTLNSEAQVRAVAHALWVEEGMPDGRAEAHWLKAIEIVAQAAETPVAVTSKRKASAPAAAPKKAAAAAKKAAPRKRG